MGKLGVELDLWLCLEQLKSVSQSGLPTAGLFPRPLLVPPPQVAALGVGAALPRIEYPHVQRPRRRVLHLGSVFSCPDPKQARGQALVWAEL